MTAFFSPTSLTHPQVPIVSCRGIVKTFGSDDNTVFALRGVDLDVNEGEMMMLVGPSGCGKTTLISVIAGILRPDSGSCYVLGHDVATMAAGDLVSFRGREIGFIFQAFNLLPALTVVQNIAVPLVINGVPRTEAFSRAAAMIAEVGLKGREDSMPNALSGGQQQRVAIARSLVHAPKLLVCDEPTSALDHETGEHIMALMRRVMRDHHTTLIIVTHDNRIFGFADRIARMDDGHIVGEENG